MEYREQGTHQQLSCLSIEGQYWKVRIGHGCCQSNQTQSIYWRLVSKNLGKENSLQCTNLAVKGCPMLDVNMRLVKYNELECGAMRALYENMTGVSMIDNKLWR